MYSNIIQVFTLFMKAIFPTLVGGMDPWSLT